MLGALLFSTANSLQLWLQVLGVDIPASVANMLPYILTIVALTVTVRKGRRPAALNTPFLRGGGVMGTDKRRPWRVLENISQKGVAHMNVRSMVFCAVGLAVSVSAVFAGEAVRPPGRPRMGGFALRL